MRIPPVPPRVFGDVQRRPLKFHHWFSSTSAQAWRLCAEPTSTWVARAWCWDRRGTLDPAACTTCPQVSSIDCGHDECASDGTPRPRRALADAPIRGPRCRARCSRTGWVAWRIVRPRRTRRLAQRNAQASTSATSLVSSVTRPRRRPPAMSARWVSAEGSSGEGRRDARPALIADPARLSPHAVTLYALVGFWSCYEGAMSCAPRGQAPSSRFVCSADGVACPPRPPSHLFVWFLQELFEFRA